MVAAVARSVARPSACCHRLSCSTQEYRTNPNESIAMRKPRTYSLTAGGGRLHSMVAALLLSLTVLVHLRSPQVKYSIVDDKKDHLVRPTTASIEKHRASIRYLGHRKFNTGWYIDELCLKNKKSLLVYGVGAGEDITFDMEMANLYGASVVVIDPTEKAERHVQSVLSKAPKHQNIQFLAKGLSDQQGEVTFALPANPKHVSMRAVGLADPQMTRTTTAPVQRLQDFMTQLGHDYLDVLKIDIEGAEYDVLEALIRDDFLPFTQLLVEYHDRFLKGAEKSRHHKVLEGLKDAGFVELWSQHRGQERGYIKKNDLEYCADGTSKRFKGANRPS